MPVSFMWNTAYYLAVRIALIMRLVLRSALALCSDDTAHSAAGNHPINVS